MDQLRITKVFWVGNCTIESIGHSGDDLELKLLQNWIDILNEIAFCSLIEFGIKFGPPPIENQVEFTYLKWLSIPHWTRPFSG